MANNDYQIVPVPIRPGMREDIHRHAAADPGTLRYAKNVRWGVLGAALRRNGTTALVTTTDPGAQYPLNSGYPVELLQSAPGGTTIAGTDGVAYALRANESGWHFAGRYSSAEPRAKFDFYLNQAGQPNPPQVGTCAVDSAGYRFLAYASDAGGGTGFLHYVVQDSNGNSIRLDTIADCRRVRAVAVGAVIYVCVQLYATNAISVYSITAGGVPTLLAAALVTLDASGDSWDISPWTSTHWVFAALDSSSTTVTVRRMSGGTSAATATQSTNMRASSRITIYADTDHVWLGWSDNSVSNLARVTCWNWTGSAFSSTFTSSTAFSWTVTTQTGSPPIIGKGPSATQVRVLGSVFNESGHATPDMYTWRHLLVTTAGTFTKDTSQFHGVPLSKPFGPRGEYVWADLRVRKTPATADSPAVVALLRTRDYTSQTTTYYVIDLVSHRDPEGFNNPLTDWWNYAVQAPSGQYIYPVRQLTSEQSSALGAGATPYNLYWRFLTFEINSTLGHRDSTRMKSRLQVAGQPCSILPGARQYDAGLATALFSVDGQEQGIHRGPTVMSVASSNSTGSLTSLGVYSYVAVYRWIDADGELHRSAPGGLKSITLGAADDTVALVLSTIEWERKFNEPGSVALYRTTASGTTYYLVSDSIENTAGAATVAYTDTVSDSDLETRQILYTQVQQVAHDMAPACQFTRSSESRVWAGGLWNTHVIQASKIIVPGEPIQWSDLDTFKVVLPEACTGLAFQDGALLAFAATNIYAIGTDGGPGNDGLQSFADPRLIAPGIGTESAASIVETPQGVVFKSRRGFEMMPRGLGPPQPLPGVEDQIAAYPYVISGTLHVDDNGVTVRYVMRAGAAGTATIVLVYDLDRQAWSIDWYPIDLAQVGVTADGRFLAASDDTSTSPAFLVEATSAKDDNGTFFQSRLTFHDIYPFGVYKEGQVNSILARAGSDGTCVLRVDAGVDGATARSVPWTFSGAVTFEVYSEQTPAATSPRGTSIQLDVYDTSSGDAASGVAYYGFGLHLSDKDSVVNLPSAQRQ